MRTSGGPPTAPPDSRWIQANTTHAKFDTNVWGDGGCGPVALKLEWAGSGAAGARDIPVGGEVILGGKCLEMSDIDLELFDLKCEISLIF